MMNLQGVFAPIPTPFDNDDRLDTSRLRAALTKWLATPLTGFVVLGSNGEAVLLDEDEAERAIAAARETIPSGRPMIVGTGRESTRAAIRATRRAAELGADAVLVRTPGFFKNQMTADAFAAHYSAVADASPVPILLYNFTALTGVDLLPASVARLAAHPNIIGMKESGGDVGRYADLVAAATDDFTVLAGSASTFFASLCIGARGGVLALACVLPDACTRVFELVRAQRFDDARVLQAQILPLAKLLGATGVPGLKAALNLIGYDVGVPRRPLAPLSDTNPFRDAIAQLAQGGLAIVDVRLTASA